MSFNKSGDVFLKATTKEITKKVYLRVQAVFKHKAGDSFVLVRTVQTLFLPDILFFQSMFKQVSINHYNFVWFKTSYCINTIIKP